MPLFNKPSYTVKPPNLVDGTKFQRVLPALSQTEKALRGHKLQTGTLAMTHFSRRQAARDAGIPMALIRAVDRATPAELAQMELGILTVEELHQAQLARRRSSDKNIERLIAAAGSDRVLAALDRLTTPATNGAEAPPAALVTNGMAAPANNDADDDEPADWWKTLHVNA